jgi:hypothetical protein
MRGHYPGEWAGLAAVCVFAFLGRAGMLVLPRDKHAGEDATVNEPFAWQDKRLLRRIRESVEDYGSAIAVYVALTVAASDKASEEFQTTHQWLSTLSGFGERTVRSRLRDLVEIGAVHITTPALRGPCTYRLLTFGNDNRTNGNQCRAFGKVATIPLPGSELVEQKKGNAKPLTTPQRISAEKQLTELRATRTRLREETSEPWQRQEYPERLTKLREVELQIEETEGRLRV